MNFADRRGHVQLPILTIKVSDEDQDEDGDGVVNADDVCLGRCLMRP